MEANEIRKGNISERGSRENKIDNLLSAYESHRISRIDLIKSIVSDEEQIVMFAKEAMNTAEIDPLTSALNRRGLKWKVDVLDTSRIGYGLLVFDIDHFKNFNDTFGHEAGDIVLQETVAEVTTHLREPGRIDLIGRLGGEEFAVVVPGIDTLEKIKDLGERIRIGIASRKIVYGGQILNVTVSLGGVLNEESLNTLENTIKDADKLMYKAKKGGRNRVEVA